MYQDFKELLSILNGHRVKYLVVGAYAVGVHAQPLENHQARNQRAGASCPDREIRRLRHTGHVQVRSLYL
jgi:hypothetical protein